MIPNSLIGPALEPRAGRRRRLLARHLGRATSPHSARRSGTCTAARPSRRQAGRAHPRRALSHRCDDAIRRLHPGPASPIRRAISARRSRTWPDDQGQHRAAGRLPGLRQLGHAHRSRCARRHQRLDAPPARRRRHVPGGFRRRISAPALAMSTSSRSGFGRRAAENGSGGTDQGSGRRCSPSAGGSTVVRSSPQWPTLAPAHWPTATWPSRPTTARSSASCSTSAAGSPPPRRVPGLHPAGGRDLQVADAATVTSGATTVGPILADVGKSGRG